MSRHVPASKPQLPDVQPHTAAQPPLSSADLQPPPAGLMRWRARAERLARPEVVVGAVIVAAWAGLAVMATVASIPLAVAAALAMVWLHLASVETGNYTLSWVTTGLVVMLIVTGLSNLGDHRPSPLVYTAASCTALAHNELVRLSYARRRRGQVARSAHLGAGLGIGLASVVALVGIGLAQALSRGVERSWWWMPAAVGVLVAVAVVMTVAPARRAPAAIRVRWRPGDRLPPPTPPSDEPDHS
jgi:hypothetical protein